MHQKSAILKKNMLVSEQHTKVFGNIILVVSWNQISRICYKNLESITENQTCIMLVQDQ